MLTSAETGEGLDELRAAIALRPPRRGCRRRSPREHRRAMPRQPASAPERPCAPRRRTLLAGGGEELVAIELRLAIDELGKVVGAVVTDEILDRIFQRFCIGK